MENEVYENDVTTDETIDDFYTEEEEAGSGIIGKVILGGAALATGVAGGFIIKHRTDIADKYHDFKAKRLAKRVEKERAKLAKLEAKQAPTEEAEKKE